MHVMYEQLISLARMPQALGCLLSATSANRLLQNFMHQRWRHMQPEISQLALIWHQLTPHILWRLPHSAVLLGELGHSGLSG